jgi:hypothetical protein
MTIEPGNLCRSLSAMLDFGLIEESAAAAADRTTPAGGTTG